MRSLRPSRARGVRLGVVCAALLAATPIAAQPAAPKGSDGSGASSASAGRPAPRGADALTRARAAWQRGDFDIAEPLYKEAIEKGGLAPDDVLDAYAHLGAARASLGKVKPALAAFVEASIIDAKFEVPSEAGKRAKALAEQARRVTKKIGSIKLAAQAPSTVKPGESFDVGATLDTPHLKLVKKVGIFVRDPLSGKSYETTTPPAASIHFEVPTNMTLPSATLVVRIDALDSHENRLGSSESKVHVEALTVPIAEAPPPHADKPRASDGVAMRPRAKDHAKSSGGFWSSAWPYVLGGVALAAGGAAAFIVTRPTDDVNLAGPRMQVR